MTQYNKHACKLLCVNLCQTWKGANPTIIVATTWHAPKNARIGKNMEKEWIPLAIPIWIQRAHCMFVPTSRYLYSFQEVRFHAHQVVAKIEQYFRRFKITGYNDI